MNAETALNYLKEGNEIYTGGKIFRGNISKEMRKELTENGQKPYAVVIACSDSRVIPEVIFSAGLGELFVIRVAGNVLDDHQLGSIEYAVDHLHTKLVVLLGHTHCGAVGAAVAGGAHGYTGFITDEIRKAIGNEKDERKASILNVQAGVKEIRETFVHDGNPAFKDAMVQGALYDIETGKVLWDL